MTAPADERQQKATLLLDHYETRERLVALRKSCAEVGDKLAEAGRRLRDCPAEVFYGDPGFAEAINFEKIRTLVFEVRQTGERLESLQNEAQRLGLKLN